MRILGVAAVVIVALMVSGIGWSADYIYGQNVPVDPDCHGSALFSPDSAKLAIADNPLSHRIDPGVYGKVEQVSFPSRDGKVEVSALLSPAPAGAPLVIATHGYTGCKHHVHGLSILGILASEGYAVLVLDLREHGESTVLDGVAAMGSDEFNDVLGAYDFAQDRLGFVAGDIGFWGESMGGASTLIANTVENLGPLFVDAPFANIKMILKDNANRASVPAWSVEIISPAVRLLRGYDFVKANPINGLVQRPDQPVFWVHGTDDKVTGVHHALMAQDATAAMPAKTFLIPEGVGHVATLWDRPTEYRTVLLAFFDEHLKG